MPDETNPQTKWLLAFSGVAASAQVARNRQEAKQQVVTRIQQDIESSRAVIEEGLSLSIRRKAGETVVQKILLKLGADLRVNMKEGKGQAIKELDTYHHAGQLESLTPEEMKKVYAAMEAITRMRESMSEAVDEEGEPLFDDLDIADELWTPLHREGLIPENPIPDRYSEVARVFKGASELYNQRLAEAEPDSKLDQFVAVLGIGKELFGVVTEQTGGVLKYAKEITEAEGLKEATKSISTTITVLKDLNSGVSKGVTGVEKGADYGQKYGPMILKYGKLAGRNLSGKIRFRDINYNVKDGTGDYAKDSGGILEKMFHQAMRASRFQTQLTRGDAPAALLELGGYMASVLPALDTGETEGAFAAMGRKIQAALAKAAADGRATQFRKAFEAGAKEREKAIEEIMTLVASSIADMEPLEQTRGMEAAFGDKGLRRVDAMVEAMESKVEAEEVENDVDEFRYQLAAGFAGTGDGEDDEAVRRAMEKASSIEALTKRVAQMNKVFKVAESIVDMSVKLGDKGTTKVLGTLFNPDKIADQAGKEAAKHLLDQAALGIGIVTNAKDLIKELIKTAKCAKELKRWQGLVNDGDNASTVYAEAFRNKRDQSIVEGIQHGIIACFKAAQIVANACQFEPHAAVAAKGVSVGLTVAEALTNTGFKLYGEKKLRDAWKTYKKAVANPGDRIEARKSMRQNPTFAKYVIAYGATVERHPIAVEAMNVCGLSPTVLADPNTNAEKVVTYLETLYADDPVLVKFMGEEQPKWHPGKPRLDAASWVAFVAAAEKKAKLAPKDRASQRVLNALTRLDAAVKGYRKVAAKAEGDDIRAVGVALTRASDVLDVLAGVKKALSAYKPTTAGSKELHEGMAKIAEVLMAEAKQNEQIMSVTRAGLERRQSELKALADRKEEEASWKLGVVPTPPTLVTEEEPVERPVIGRRRGRVVTERPKVTL